jgi:hypothetical protein
VLFTAALKIGDVQAHGLAVNELLGVLETDFVLGFGFHLLGPYKGFLNLGFAEFVGVVGFVNQHAQRIIGHFNDAAIGREILALGIGVPRSPADSNRAGCSDTYQRHVVL